MIKISRKKIEGLTKKAMAGTRKSPVRIESCIFQYGRNLCYIRGLH